MMQTPLRCVLALWISPSSATAARASPWVEVGDSLLRAQIDLLASDSVQGERYATGLAGERGPKSYNWYPILDDGPPCVVEFRYESRRSRLART